MSDDPNAVRVYAKVVADLLHPGHVRFFRAARALGTHLTVQVVPDERVARMKRAPLMTTAERAEVVASCRYVDAVICDGPKEATLEFMRAHRFQIYAFGAKDDTELAQKLADCAELPPHMVARVDYTAGISTSDLVARLRARFDAVAD